MLTRIGRATYCPSRYCICDWPKNRNRLSIGCLLLHAWACGLLLRSINPKIQNEALPNREEAGHRGPASDVVACSVTKLARHWLRRHALAGALLGLRRKRPLNPAHTPTAANPINLANFNTKAPMTAIRPSFFAATPPIRAARP